MDGTLQHVLWPGLQTDATKTKETKIELRREAIRERFSKGVKPENLNAMIEAQFLVDLFKRQKLANAIAESSLCRQEKIKLIQSLFTGASDSEIRKALASP